MAADREARDARTAVLGHRPESPERLLPCGRRPVDPSLGSLARLHPGHGRGRGREEQGQHDAHHDWEVSAPKDATMRIGIDPQDMVILQHYNSLLAEAVAGLSSDEWTRVAGEVGVPVQPVRSPEEALLDPAFLADGCVVEVDDPEVGTIRQVGSVYRLSACPTAAPGPRPALGQHSAAVRAEAASAGASPVVKVPPPGAPEGPLAGIRVLDLGARGGRPLRHPTPRGSGG